ncbi:hypothetical protein [Rossellomorea aquimaris]|uniref:DUF3953 domain-containing protein n=1 Tax=Rossellomorea aquimaris TaxID=189382 RepID=A0A5D4UMJ6_9BACI|nr:hypothetical protein [Rossellomorea aquimaris]TYS81889.1 hypothetical protein FZD05_03555 [Rossellomorea aquimaris]TYS88513.1 hypothetical protein FZC85_03555 [Rossellomorea aquimaris]
MKKQIAIILGVSVLLISLLFYIGPFEQSLMMQMIFLFSTTVMSYASYKNGHAKPFVVLSICSLVSLSSILLMFV